MEAAETAMKASKIKVIRKNENGHKVIEENGWTKILYANGDIRAKIPTEYLTKYGNSLNLWIAENTK